MLKKDITYQDFNDVERTETFYFNLSRAEVAQMELSRHGGLSTYLQNLISAKDGAAIVENFNAIIMKSVGRRSADGRNFEKSEEISSDFASTGAYDALFMELITDPAAAAVFVRGIVPKDLADKMPSGDETVLGMISAATPEAGDVETLSDEELDRLLAGEDLEPKKLEDYTREELLTMPAHEFQALVGTNPQRWPRPIKVIAMQRKNSDR